MKMKYWHEYKRVSNRYVTMNNPVDNEVGFILVESFPRLKPGNSITQTKVATGETLTRAP